MRTYYPSFGLNKICRLFGISRQAYYYHCKYNIAQEFKNEQVLKMVYAIRKIHPRIGTRKIYELIRPDLNKIGLKLGRDKLFSLLSDNEMLIRKRRKRMRTTNSFHHFRKYKNLIKKFVPYAPNQLWVSDITYVKDNDRFYYLFLITDAYSHKVVGYKLGQTLETVHALEALDKALQNQNNLEGIIHHSDRGIQYCCKAYINLLKQNNVKISMAGKGNCYENATAERINGILKQEYLFMEK